MNARRLVSILGVAAVLTIAGDQAHGQERGNRPQREVPSPEGMYGTRTEFSEGGITTHVTIAGQCIATCRGCAEKRESEARRKTIESRPDTGVRVQRRGGDLPGWLILGAILLGAVVGAFRSR